MLRAAACSSCSFVACPPSSPLPSLRLSLCPLVCREGELGELEEGMEEWEEMEEDVGPQLSTGGVDW